MAVKFKKLTHSYLSIIFSTEKKKCSVEGIHQGNSHRVIPVQEFQSGVDLFNDVRGHLLARQDIVNFEAQTRHVAILKEAIPTPLEA